MTYLKNFSLIVFTFFLVYTEVGINTFLSGNEYLEALPYVDKLLKPFIFKDKVQYNRLTFFINRLCD